MLAMLVYPSAYAMRSTPGRARSIYMTGSAAAPRALATVSSGAAFTLPPLPYAYGALEPAISGEIMQIHHQKHHNAYVTNINIALEKYEKASATKNVAEMIALQGAIRFNGGEQQPAKALLEARARSLLDYDCFVD